MMDILVKAHILAGIKTNVIISARITDDTGADHNELIPMVEDARNNGFTIKELTADKAYLSREHYNYATEIGADAYIPFKSNSIGNSKGSQTWKRMYHYFHLNRDEFMTHYNKRSNVETTFKMVKGKFGDTLKSKKHTAQVNELLCKLIAHNICVVIQEMHELGIQPDFKSN